MSVKQIEDEEIFGMYTDKTIRNALALLKEKGFIQTRTNPKNPYDRATQYLFCEESVKMAHSVNLPNALGKFGECHSVDLPNDPHESSTKENPPLPPEGGGEGAASQEGEKRKPVERVKPRDPLKIQRATAMVNQVESTGPGDLPLVTSLEQWIVEQIWDTGLINSKRRLSKKQIDRLTKTVSCGGKTYRSANEQFDMHPLFKSYVTERIGWWKSYAERRTVDFLVNLIADYGKQQFGWLDYLKENIPALHATIEEPKEGGYIYHWWLGIQDDLIVMDSPHIATADATKIYGAEIRGGFSIEGQS